MIQRFLRRSMREPMPCIAVILFTAILTVILCFLHQSLLDEQKSIENTYHSIPIEFEITWLDGTRLKNSAPASGHMADILPELFLGTSRHEPQFDDLVTELKIRMSYTGDLRTAPKMGEEVGFDSEDQKVVGITTSQVAKEMYPDFGETIVWFEEFDDSVFRTDLFVCIAPSSFEGIDRVTLTFESDGLYSCTLQIVGLYPTEGDYTIYCPYAVMERIYAGINEPKVVEHLSGRLADNDNIEIFRQRAAEWFATPNPLGTPTPWDKLSYDHYPLAIDIDDSLLEGLESDLEASAAVNRIAAGLVFALSTGAGFLTGFLVIRSRKREITLMRTLGTPNGTVCGELVLEQALCVAFGVILGGSYSLWQPAWQLAVFAGVYLAGLALALLIFTRINLLATVKEDE